MNAQLLYFLSSIAKQRFLVALSKPENGGGYPSVDMHQYSSNDIEVGAETDVREMLVLTPGKADVDVDSAAKSIAHQSVVYSLLRRIGSIYISRNLRTR